MARWPMPNRIPAAASPSPTLSGLQA